MPSSVAESDWNCPTCGWNGGEAKPPSGGRLCETILEGESIDGCPFDGGRKAEAPGRIRMNSSLLIAPLELRPEDIDIKDIAHGLAQTNRFNRQTIVPYSVAQHSVLVSQHTKHPLDGLMHDAAEVYLFDAASPIKGDIFVRRNGVFKPFRSIEDQVYSIIAPIFGLSDPIPEDVNRIDKLIVEDEKRWVMNSPTAGPGLGIHITPWPWQEAERRFLERFKELTT